MSAKIKDITGQRFGKLIAVRRSGLWAGSSWWRCRCDCGRMKTIRMTSLHSGSSRSCGCMQAKAFRPGAHLPGDDEELLALDTLADLEEAFGEMHMPLPRGPVWHQSLSSDFELGVIP